MPSAKPALVVLGYLAWVNRGRIWAAVPASIHSALENLFRAADLRPSGCGVVGPALADGQRCRRTSTLEQARQETETAIDELASEADRLACSVVVALSVAACGGSQTAAVQRGDLKGSARPIVGTSLFGARGASPRDQDAIDETAAGLCGAGVWTRSECARRDAAASGGQVVMAGADVVGIRKAVTDLTMLVGRLTGTVEVMADEFRSERDSSAKSRKAVYQALEDLRHEQHRTASEIRDVSSRVERIEPAVEDYNKRQVQLETGGKLARALWWIGGGVMVAAVWTASNWEKIAGAIRGWGGR